MLVNTGHNAHRSVIDEIVYLCWTYHAAYPGCWNRPARKLISQKCSYWWQSSYWSDMLIVIVQCSAAKQRMNSVIVTHLTGACWPELTALVTLTAHGCVSFAKPSAREVPVIRPSWRRLTACHIPPTAKNILSALLEGWPSGTGWRLASCLTLIIPPCPEQPKLSHLA